MSWLRGGETAPIGIDLDGRHICAVQMNSLARKAEVRAVTSVLRAKPATPVDKKEIEHLIRLLPKRGFVGNDVVLATPADRLLTGILELPPRRSGAPVDRIARSELSRMHKVSAATLEMASWALPVPERAADTEPVMVAACPYTDSNQLLDTFESLGHSVRALDIRAWALARACEASLAEAPSMTAILEIGWLSAELVGFHGPMVVYQRGLPDAGLEQLGKKLAGKPLSDNGAIQRIVDSVRLGDQDAGDDNAGDGEMNRKAEWHFDGIAGELEVPISYLQNQYPDGYVTKLLLTGPGALISGADTHLATKLDIDVQVASPENLAVCPSELTGECGPEATVAMGLALYVEG